MNNILLVGKVYNLPQETTRDSITITIAITNPIKNEDGTFDTDYIPVEINGSMARNVIEYITVGDTIGIRGRITSTPTTNNTNDIKVKAEKVTFLAQNKSNETNQTKINEGEI